jgi:hypothetical protein
VLVALGCTVAVGGLLASLPDATARTVTSRFSPDADAFVRQAFPRSNFGAVPTLQTSAPPKQERSYLRFDLGRLAGPVVRASLRLYGHVPDRFGYTVWSAPGTSWQEDEIVDANAPRLGRRLGSTTGSARGSWTEADVTAAVANGGTVTLVLTANGASPGVYASREGGVTGPQLVVEMQAGNAVASGAMATSATLLAPTTRKAPTTSSAARATTTTASTTAPAAPAGGTGGFTGAGVRGRNRFGIAAGCCIQYLGTTELARQLDDYRAIGVRWLRFDMAWSGVQAGGRDRYDWAPYDRLVRAANERDIRLLGMIGYTPAWARPAGCRDNDKCAPANVQDFAFFAGQVARRYGPQGVHAWEIWNEQNGDLFWKPSPSPSAYASLLRAAYKEIKQNDENAWVVTGGLMPAETGGGSYSPVDFLAAVYRNGAKGSFDAVGMHPYCWAGSFDCPNRSASWSAWSQMSSTPGNLRALLTANGDQAKLIWGTEFGAPTTGSDQAAGEAGQARQVVDGYRLFGSYGWTGPLFWYSYRDACADGGDTECHFGLVRGDGSRKPAHSAYRQAADSAS